MASETYVMAKLSEEVENADTTELVSSKALAENNNSSPLQETSLDNRLKRKAKRPSKSLSSDNKSVENVISVNGSYLRYSKNSRRSRNGYGRGLPKKGIITSDLLCSLSCVVWFLSRAILAYGSVPLT